ncbi:MAG: tripartite tricarboxylate transporter TctB family protein [Rubrivivax sp.]|nr:tripartite tricarboxylate transporter TctB family protein [Rubrivivax sp.]
MPPTQRRVDLGIGLALSLLAAAVLWSARAFPAVPGQKVGAGFLPMLVGAGLLACGVALVWRALRPRLDGGAASEATGSARPAEHYGSAAVLVAVVAGYLLLAERLGFLIVAPLGLVAMLRAFRVGWLPSLGWAVGGTLLVHLAFYKLLRVPLPWGVLRPFY